MNPTSTLRRALPAVLMLWACGAALAADAQVWEYKSYKKSGGSGEYEKDKFVLGTISVEPQDGGQWAFRMIAGRADVCYRGALPATVVKTEELTTIEVTRPLPGCEAFRYVIRNDGSGGYKEVQVSEQWRRERFDHGLTPKK